MTKIVMQHPALLKIHNLEAGYGPGQVLFGVDLEVGSGELVVLIGPNGAGKSTVLRSVFGLTAWKKGSINFCGEDIGSLSTSSLVAKGISYVPQGRIVFPNLTVLENLEIASWMEKKRSVIDERLGRVFALWPVLKEKLSQRAGLLSGGQQQMVALGRALMQSPKLLFLDEPSLGLSPKIIQETFETIARLRDEGLSILMVEQNARAAAQIADRLYLLEQGRVVLSGGRELLEHPQIRKVYLGGV